MSGREIPDVYRRDRKVVSGNTMLDAARDYAAAGIYVLPVYDQKNPGSRVGKGWPDKSSIDPVSIRDHWREWPEDSIALHMGPSWLMAVDVDDPDALPEDLAAVLAAYPTAYQATRRNAPGRGHYVYELDEGEEFGSSTRNFPGKAGRNWGEFRAGNAVIIAAPSLHPKAASADEPPPPDGGGHYEWQRREIARRPEALAAFLLPPGKHRAAVTTVTTSATGHAPVVDVDTAAFLAGLPDDGTPCPGAVRVRAPLPAASRHPEMCVQSQRLVRLGEQGHYGVAPLLASLEAEFVAAIADRADEVTARAEYLRALDGAVREVTADPTPESERGCCGLRARKGPTIRETLPADVPDAAEFWAARYVLTEIYGIASCRLVAPWAVLGAVLGCVGAWTGPQVVLPPIVGSIGSLNTIWALVGRTGAGKDTALATALELLGVDDMLGVEVPRHELGTGQGLTAGYTTVDKKSGGLPVQYNDAALFTCTEIDSLAAHAAQGAATIVSTLRAAYSGAQLGSLYADKERRRPVKAHRYRMSLIAGVQPERSRVLLADRNGGLPQRVVWLPASDPTLVEQPVGGVGELRVFMAAGTLWRPSRRFLPMGEALRDLGWQGVRTELEVAESIRKVIVEDRFERLTADLAAAPPAGLLESHALLTRLKVAALLGLLSRPDDGAVTEEDWALAGTVMAVSDRTRSICEASLATESKREARGRGAAKAEEADGQDRVEVRSAAQAIVRALDRADGWVTGAVLRKALAYRLRPQFDVAADLAIRSGAAEVEEVAGQGQRGKRYRKPIKP